MLIGYARVSTNEQNLDLQQDALKKTGVSAKNLYTDKITGTKSERPGLDAREEAGWWHDTQVARPPEHG